MSVKEAIPAGKIRQPPQQLPPPPLDDQGLAIRLWQWWRFGEKEAKEAEVRREGFFCFV